MASIRNVALLILAFYLSSVGMALADTDDSGLKIFLGTWQNRILGVLENIYTQPSANEDERFLILEGGDQKYVQCHFHDSDSAVYCEVASGFYDPKHAPKFSSKDFTFLVNEGFFRSDRKGNFSLDMKMRNEAALQDVANFMAVTFYKIYGSNEGKIHICTPYVPSEYIQYWHGLTPQTAHIEYLEADEQSIYLSRCLPIDQQINTSSGWLKIYRGVTSSLWWRHNKIAEAKGLQFIGGYPYGRNRPSIISFVTDCTDEICDHPKAYFVDMGA